jgi:transposase
MRGFYLIVDNVPIHTSKEIETTIKIRSREYRYAYLPLYSPELNPIEQLWALIKGKVRRHKLEDTEALEERISDPSFAIPVTQL